MATDKKVFVRTFMESFVEIRGKRSGWEAQDRAEPIDVQMNKWLDESGSQLVSLQVTDSATEERQPDSSIDSFERIRSIMYVVTFIPQEPSAIRQDPNAAALPLIPNAAAPTVLATRVEGSVRRQAQVMAGVFGVPEGNKLHTEDTAPAPVTLLSPDLDLTPYADLFGNVAKKKDEPKKEGCNDPKCRCKAK